MQMKQKSIRCKCNLIHFTCSNERWLYYYCLKSSLCLILALCSILVQKQRSYCDVGIPLLVSKGEGQECRSVQGYCKWQYVGMSGYRLLPPLVAACPPPISYVRCAPPPTTTTTTTIKILMGKPEELNSTTEVEEFHFSLVIYDKVSLHHRSEHVQHALNGLVCQTETRENTH